MGLISFLLIPFFIIFLLMSFFFDKNPATFFEFCFRVVLDSTLFLTLLYFTTGFLWSLTGKKWIKGYQDQISYYLVLILIVSLLIYILVFLYIRLKYH